MGHSPNMFLPTLAADGPQSVVKSSGCVSCNGLHEGVYVEIFVVAVSINKSAALTLFPGVMFLLSCISDVDKLLLWPLVFFAVVLKNCRLAPL